MLTVKESQKNFIKLLILFVAIIIPWIIGFVYVNRDKADENERRIKLRL